MRIASFAIIVALLTPAILSLLVKDVYSHSMTTPFRVDTQTHFMKPGDMITSDMRVCMMLPETLTVNNVTFKGNNSDWAKVDEEQFPVTAAPSANGTASVSFPVTIAVPSNFTGDHALIHTVIETQFRDIVLPLESDLRIIISNNTVTSQNFPECGNLTDIQTGVIYNAIILGSVGAGLGAAGYFVYRRSKAKSPQHKASLGAKVLLILLSIIGFFLIGGAFLFLRSLLT